MLKKLSSTPWQAQSLSPGYGGAVFVSLHRRNRPAQPLRRNIENCSPKIDDRRSRALEYVRIVDYDMLVYILCETLMIATTNDRVLVNNTRYI